MKRIHYILLFISYLGFSQGVFERGNTYYKNGNYDKAIQAYESILKSKKHSAELYFNLANAYYKKQNVAEAIYYYEKALQLKPNDATIKNNLEFAQKLAIDDIKVMPDAGFSKILHTFTGIFSYNTWAIFAVLFSVLGLVSFIFYYFSMNIGVKQWFFGGIFIALFFMVLSVFASVFEQNFAKNTKIAIVFADEVAVKNEPKTTSETTFTLHEGTKVYVLETLDNWQKIQLNDKTVGWIESSAIKEL